MSQFFAHGLLNGLLAILSVFVIGPIVFPLTAHAFKWIKPGRTFLRTVTYIFLALAAPFLNVYTIKKAGGYLIEHDSSIVSWTMVAVPMVTTMLALGLLPIVIFKLSSKEA